MSTDPEVELLKVIVQRQESTDEAVKDLARGTFAGFQTMVAALGETNAALGETNAAVKALAVEVQGTNRRLDALAVEVQGIRTDLRGGLARQDRLEARVERLEDAVFKPAAE
jgi:hypothetical protein